MSEHWYVEEQPNGTVLVWSRATDSGDEDKYVVAVAGIGPKADRLALAHRIAALPDMLEALSGLYYATPDQVNDGNSGQWLRAEAAIAKATGAPTVSTRAEP
jgi:hypothetical protein